MINAASILYGIVRLRILHFLFILKRLHIIVIMYK